MGREECDSRGCIVSQLTSNIYKSTSLTIATLPPDGFLQTLTDLGATDGCRPQARQAPEVIDFQISWLQADRHLKQSWLRDNRAVFELMQAGNSLDYGRTKAVFAGGSLSLAPGPSVIIALLRTVPAHNILSPISLIDPFVPFPPSNLSQYPIFNNLILILNSW